MFSPIKDQALLCEQCGVELPAGARKDECLHCLLTGGLEMTDRTEDPVPNEYNTRFYQHYEILKHSDGTLWELGRGAMGVTYKACDHHLKTVVALKLINTRFALRSDARRRFLREAKAAARLRHPNVASVFHFGTGADLPDDPGAERREVHPEGGDCFYAMEFVQGETLASRLKRNGPLTPELALNLGVQAARALSAAELRGLIHRDLKPSNIMLASSEFSAEEKSGCPGQDWVKVIDFGLAKLEDDGERPTGKFIGTRAFASPEQVQSRSVDSRADIYSLGATLWYSLTGEVPSRPTTSVNGSTRSPTIWIAPRAGLKRQAVPAPLAALLQSALAFNPGDRPSTALEFGQKLQKCLDELAKYPPTRTTATQPHWFRRKVLTSALVIATVGLLMAPFLFTALHSPEKTRSIAVLPFRNLSDASADVGYGNRVQQDILAQLGRVRNLKVINLLPATRDPAKPNRDLREIGHIFGIRHVLEGSLRRTNDQVYLHLALIDTSDGHELWAEGYDRQLANAMNMRGDLGVDIADALDATVSFEESSGGYTPPPNKPDADVLYLRGRRFEQTLRFAISDYEAAEMLYSQAIALDPRFALAHARLASVLSLLYSFRGPNEELKRRAYSELKQALQLQPNLGEARLVRALCSYRLEHDAHQSQTELEQARALLPNDSEAEKGLVLVERSGGDWRQAQARMERCLARDPENIAYQEELFQINYLLRDWVAAEANALRVESLAPERPLARAQKAMIEVWRKGDATSLNEILTGLPSYGDSEGILTWLRWDAAMLQRDYLGAKAAIERFPFDTLSSVYAAPVPKVYLEACLALATGDQHKAREKFELCRPAYEAEALAHPGSALRHARLGLLYAYLGRADDAVQEGKRATELEPIELDHVEGPAFLANLALIYARLGQKDASLMMIQSLLRTPGAIFFGEASMTLWELRLRWQWDPLRGDPRFEAIVAGSESATNY